MTHYFWDSSALIKRYITETGTGWVRALLLPSAKHTILLAQITPIELASALARRQREGSVAPRTAQAARLFIERHIRRQYVVLGLSNAIVERAKALVNQHMLRAYDAVQLATALEANQRLLANQNTPVIVVSGDQRLLAIATTEGLATENPNTYP